MCTGKDTKGTLQKACKKREKWRGKNRVQVMSLGENVDASRFRADGWLGGVGWEILRAGQRGEGGGIFRLLSLVFCLELDTPSGGSRSALREESAGGERAERAGPARLVSPRFTSGRRKGPLGERKGGGRDCTDCTSTYGCAKKRAGSERVWARSAVRFGGERMRKLAKHAKTRAVLDRLWALSAVRFGGERMRKWKDNAKTHVLCDRVHGQRYSNKYSVKKRAKHAKL